MDQGNANTDLPLVVAITGASGVIYGVETPLHKGHLELMSHVAT